MYNNGRKDLAGTDAFTKLQERANRFKIVLDKCGDSADRFERELSEAGLHGAHAIDDAKMLMSEFESVSVNTERIIKKSASSVNTQTKAVDQASEAIKRYVSLRIKALRTNGGVSLQRNENGKNVWVATSEANQPLADALNERKKD